MCDSFTVKLRRARRGASRVRVFAQNLLVTQVLEYNIRAALPFGKTALFVMKMKKPNYLAFMAAL